MILSLDTSTLILSLCLAERGPSGFRVIEEGVRGPPEKQSELLPGLIGEFLARHQVPLASLEGFVAGLGPGSFTGLRIGLSSLKALAYAVQRPLVGVSSLAAVALEGPEQVPLLTLAVSRKNELYVGHFWREGEVIQPKGEEQVQTPEALAAWMKDNPTAVALGPAVEEYRATLEQGGVASNRLLSHVRYPSAVALARLAPTMGPFSMEALFALEPHYVQGSGAERNPQFPPLPGPAPVARIHEG